MPNQAQILIIDDVPENIELIGATLADQYDISFANSGSEGLRLIREQKPDLILLDIMMPVMDGYEVFAALQADPDTRAIPVIFVTARSDSASESAALRAGAVDFIHKPINLDVVRARVGLHLQMARYRDHLEQSVAARTSELASERDRAEAANRAKSAFLANISHELRTPLNQIVGLIELAMRSVTDQQAWTCLDQARLVSHGFLKLIENLLDVSRLEADQIQVRERDFALRPWCEQIAATHRSLAASKGLAFALEIDPALPDGLHGDPDILEGILEPLLSNAVKFSHGGRITLRIQRQAAIPVNAAGVRFEVEDQGIGMSPAVQQGLFALFNQGDNSLTRRYGGTGIGLTLSQRLAALLGGQLDYRSTPGVGSTFGCNLQLAVAVPSAAPTAQV